MMTANAGLVKGTLEMAEICKHQPKNSGNRQISKPTHARDDICLKRSNPGWRDSLMTNDSI